MKKLLTILISCSLALAAAALAQQDEASPARKKHRKGEQGQAQSAQPSMNQGRPARESRPGNAARPAQNRKAMRKQRAEAKAPAETATAPAASQSAAETNARGKNARAKAMRDGPKMQNEQRAPNETATNQARHPSTASAGAQTSASDTASQPGKKRNAKGKKPDPQVVQKVKTQHANFKAEPKPQKVPPVTFSQNYRINGAQQWQGPQYEVFRAYRPARHDQGWYRSHYTRVEIIAGGAYYFNNGYWYPAWGYNPSYQYYAYDAPIYVGSRAEPPDRVIADVQAILQEEGYYKGEVDGLLGPLTREALTEYQTDHGLYATATIDEPTLASLNLS